MKTAFRFLIFWCTVMVACTTIRASSTDAMTGYRLPVDFQTKLGFGWLDGTGDYYTNCKDIFHQGADLNHAVGSGDYEKDNWLFIRAIANGTVVFADDSKWASLIIRHDQEKARFIMVSNSWTRNLLS